MAQEIFSEEVKSHQFERTLARMVFPFRQTRNPAREVFEKLSSKLKELALPGIEYAEQYLFHLYSRNRRPNTLELNYSKRKRPVNPIFPQRSVHGMIMTDNPVL